MSQWTLIQSFPSFGKTQWLIRHQSCGKDLTVYPWSFAGQGKRCPHCREKIEYWQRRTPGEK